MEGEGKFCLPTVEEAKDDESKLDNPTHELLLYHYRLAHEPFKNLQQMATDSILPKRLAHYRVPKCAACYHARGPYIFVHGYWAKIKLFDFFFFVLLLCGLLETQRVGACILGNLAWWRAGQCLVV
jgi:hypothetical protein